MKKGDVVKIYEQPLTETKFEGEAKLISFIKYLNVDVELWRVKFIDDGQIVSRAIKVEKEEEEETITVREFIDHPEKVEGRNVFISTAWGRKRVGCIMWPDSNPTAHCPEDNAGFGRSYCVSYSTIFYIK